jgi:hypothetical protein
VGDLGPFAEIEKKEEFPGTKETWRLGTPFPRSALFLYTTLEGALE